MSTFHLVLPVSELHNSNHRGHWSVASSKRANMRLAARVAAAECPRISGRVALTVTFAFPDKRWRDLDNIEIKGAIDGAVDAGLIDDDRRQILRSTTRVDSDEPSPKGHAVLTFTFEAVGA